MKTLLWLALLCQDPEFVYERRGTREETRQASVEATQRRIAAVTPKGWKRIGPFDNAQGRGVRIVYPPEVELKFSAEYPGAGGKTVRWEDAKAKEREVLAFPFFDQGVGYYHLTLEAEAVTKWTLLVGSTDALAVWLNGARIFEHGTPRRLPSRKDEVELPLKKGSNSLLFKLACWTRPAKFSYELHRLSPSVLEALEERLDVDFPDAGERSYYRLETIRIPEEAVLEVGGLAFMADGRLMIATRRGEIWSLKENAWKRYASGLHEPLGLLAGDEGELYAMQRPELTRIRDTDGDGQADLFETIGQGWGILGNYHEYVFGPVRDREGNFWGTLNLSHDGKEMKSLSRYRGWCFKVTPAGEFVPWSKGLRSPNGLGLNPEGDLFVTDNQGEFLGSSVLHHVTRDAFHGHPASLAWDPSFKKDPLKAPLEELDRLRKLPAVIFPYGAMGQSPSQPLCDPTAGKFGPFAGQFFVGDQTRSMISRVVLEKVGGEYQGACFPFRAGFQSGNNRLAFAPDGSLWVGQTDRGWASIGGEPYGLQRLVWTGRAPMEIHAMTLTKEGFDLVLTKPVDPKTAQDPSAYSMQHYHYQYHKTYGSPQVDVTPVKVTGVRISEEGRRVSLVLPSLVASKVYELHLRGLKAIDGAELLHPSAYYTVNSLRK